MNVLSFLSQTIVEGYESKELIFNGFAFAEVVPDAPVRGKGLICLTFCETVFITETSNKNHCGGLMGAMGQGSNSNFAYIPFGLIAETICALMPGTNLHNIVLRYVPKRSFISVVRSDFSINIPENDNKILLLTEE